MHLEVTQRKALVTSGSVGQNSIPREMPLLQHNSCAETDAASLVSGSAVHSTAGSTPTLACEPVKAEIQHLQP